MRENGGLRLKGKGNETGEPASFILELAQLPQMIDPMGQGFNMAVEHGAGAAAAHLMPGAMDLEPLSRRLFAMTDGIAHNRIKNFRATTGDRAEAMLPQKLERIANWHPKNPLGKMADFDGGERFDVQIGIEGTHPSKKLQVPIFL